MRWKQGKDGRNSIVAHEYVIASTREATVTHWKEIRKESPGCWDRSPPGHREASVGSVNRVESCDPQRQNWKGFAVLVKEEGSKAIRLKILTKHEPLWNGCWCWQLGWSNEWEMGSQGRRKAARLFLISPTEDMYVRELCSYNWIPVLFKPQNSG